jgi:hypothetical protein
MLKSCDFVDINDTFASDTTLPTTLGGSPTTSPPVTVILQRQLVYLYVRVYVAPSKAKFFPLSRVDYYLLLPRPTLGGYAMQANFTGHRLRTSATLSASISRVDAGPPRPHAQGLRLKDVHLLTLQSFDKGI